MTTPDDLTATVHSALTALDPARKAEFLLDTALALIDAGRYGDEVERYLEVYLKTPNLPKTKVAKALLARANARKASGDRLLSQAYQDFQAVIRLDPSNRNVANEIRRRTQIRFAHDPPSHRAPPEVWSRIATYIPRYHLRTWLSLSSFHRSIALHHIFHSIDLYFGEDQPEQVNRSLDIFERVKADKDFASRVRVLRVHWAYEEGELLDLTLRVFKTALPEFYALREFEWIGYPELRQDMVQSVLASHPRLTSLGSIGFHFDACGIKAFNSLQKLTLRAEDDDGYADWSEINHVLDNNRQTLQHLTLGAYLLRQHSWDHTFSSPTIHNLTHLDLVDTRISHTVLTRIAHAAGGVNGRLESLTLHGVVEEPGKAAVVFGSDEVVNGKHTLLPRLKSFRFLLVGQPQVITPPPPAQSPPSVPPPGHQPPYYHSYPPNAVPPHPGPSPTPAVPHPQTQQPHPHDHYDPAILHLYSTVVHFLRGRTNLRRLDLGTCPWDLVAPIIPSLKGLRVFGVRIGCLSRGCGISGGTLPVGHGVGGVDLSGCMSELDVLVKSLPKEVGALRVEAGVSELPLHVYATHFQKFNSLSFLHMQLHTTQPTFHPPAITPTTAVSATQPHQQYYPYYQLLAQQQQHPSTAQTSYHSFPPQPSQPAASGSGPGPTAGVPGTPKRRNAQKRNGGEQDDADETPVTGGSGSSEGANANAAGPSSSGSNPGYSGMAQSSRQPSQIGHHVYHNHVHLLSQPHAPIPLRAQTEFVPPIPPQPLGTLESAKHVAATVKSLDFVGWNGELYVIVRGQNSVSSPGNKEEPGAGKATAGVAEENAIRSSEPATDGTGGGGVSTTPAPTTPDIPPAQTITARTAMSQQPPTPPLSSVAPTSRTSVPPGSQSSQAPEQQSSAMASTTISVELKELPARRRLDCGKGVDLGGEDAVWLERKDVPMDYDMPVGGAAVEA